MTARARKLSIALVALLVLTLPSTAIGLSPEPSSEVPGRHAPPPASPEPGPVQPRMLARSTTVEQDGVRVTIELERNPMPAAEPTWLTIRIKNIGKRPLYWWHDSCAIPMVVRGELEGVFWRRGQAPGRRDVGGLKWRASEWWSGRGGPITIVFQPQKYIDRTMSCDSMGMRSTIEPGGVLRQRARWDGNASYRLGPPPGAPVELVGRFDGYTRRKGADPGRVQGNVIEVRFEALIVHGRDEDLLHPMEVLDAALADPSFAEFVSQFDIGSDWTTEVIWYDPGLALWEVGVFDYQTETFKVGLVDPRSGSVLDVIERPLRRDREPFP